MTKENRLVNRIETQGGPQAAENNGMASINRDGGG